MAGVAQKIQWVGLMAYKSYEIWLTTDRGKRIAMLSPYLELQYSIIANEVGTLAIALPPTFDTRMISQDYTIQVWRAGLSEARQTLQRLYLIRGWQYQKREGSLRIIVRGQDTNNLLERRVVAYASGLAFTDKLGYADDLMRELVNENLVAATDEDRNLSFMSVGPQLSKGPILHSKMAYKNLLKVCKDLAGASRAAGTEVFFDVHPIILNADFSCEFRTKVGQPGEDITKKGALFSDEAGNLVDGALEYDYRGARNVVYSIGQGSGSLQNVQEVADSTRSKSSRFARYEASTTSSGEEDDAVTYDGQATLDAQRPLIRFSGGLVDSDVARYGADWKFGDKAYVKFLGKEYPVVIRAVQVTVKREGVEEIDARAEYES